jgi:hypothetical protein
MRMLCRKNRKEVHAELYCESEKDLASLEGSA